MAYLQTDTWLNELAAAMSEKTTRFFLWGTGSYGKEFYEKYKTQISIVGFIDADAKKEYEIFDGIRVYPASKAAEVFKQCKVIVAEKRTKRLCHADVFLENMGFRKNQDYYHAKFFESVYGAYVLDKAVLNYVEISITEKCSLKCKHCSLFMPYFKHPSHTDLTKLLQDIDLLFQNIDYVFHFRLLGGEPLLHPQIREIVTYLVERYREKIDYFDIITNGTVVPDAALLETCKKGGVTIAVSDYQVNAAYVRKVDNLVHNLQDHGVAYHRTSYDYWYELGFPLEKKHEADPEEKEKMFQACGTQWRSFYDKKLYFCSVNACAQRAGLDAGLVTDYFPFSDKVGKKELLKFNLGFNTVGYNSICGLCRGYMPDVNRKHVKAGEQITAEDAQKILEQSGIGGDE